MSKVKVVHIKDVKGERREPPRTSWILVSEKTVGSKNIAMGVNETYPCLLYTSPSPRDRS